MSKLAEQLAPLKAALRKVELKKDMRRSDPIRHSKPWLINRGGYIIEVDGKTWGEIRMTSHGVHGSRYMVCDPVGRAATVQEPSTLKPGATHGRTFEVRGDKSERRGLRPGQEFKPLAYRLEKAVCEAIDAGALRDPDEVKVESLKAAEERRRQQAEAIQEKETEFEERAKIAFNCLTPDVRLPMSADNRAALIAGIVAAMKWAQSR